MSTRNTALDAKYQFEYDVGLWTFGTIQVLKDRQTKELVTCKTVSKSAVRRQDHVLEKLAKLRKIRHHGISSTVDVLEDQNCYYIIAEKLPGNDVADWVIRVQEEGCWLQEQTIASYLRQTLVAVNHAHDQRIVHQDLRPSSLALTSKLPDARVKVCDMGLASVLDPSCEALRRTPGPYTAPEVLRGGGRLNPTAADMWSVGAIAHTLLVGQPPDQEKENQSWGAQVAAGLLSNRNSSLDSWNDRSSLSQDFVEKLLREAGDRPTAAQALQHPWLKGTVSLEAEHIMPGSELQHRLVCTMLALLLIPDFMEYKNIYKVRELFQQHDVDVDGFVGKQCAEKILMDRGHSATSAAAALTVMDVRATGAIDLCALTCAAFVATEFFQKEPCSPNELTGRMMVRFFACFGKSTTAANVSQRLQEVKQAAIVRDLEVHASVDYDEILECLAELGPLDVDSLQRAFGQCGAAGTPLKMTEDDEPDESVWGDRLNSMAGLQSLACTMFGSCGMMSATGYRNVDRISAVW